MKGIILNLVEEAVVGEHGDQVWDAVLDAASLDGAWTSMGDYPDEHLGLIVAAGSQVLDVPPRELTLELGRHALTGLAKRYPQYFETHDDTRAFLLTLNDVIHPEVRKLHPLSEPPDFSFEGSDPDVLRVHYRSARRLCFLAEGMVHGAGAHYGERVSVSHEPCMHDGADHCTLSATFAKAS